jgi:hypothetical protein
MTVSTVAISSPRGIRPSKPIEVHVTKDTLVSEVIRRALLVRNPGFSGDPSCYGLLLLPEGKFLYRNCLLAHYRSYLCTESVLELRCRLARGIRVVYFRYAVNLECDPGWTASPIIHQAIQNLAEVVTVPPSDHWTLAHAGGVLPADGPLSSIFGSLPSEVIPTAFLRRELAAPEGSDLPKIFRGSIIGALTKTGDPAIPFFARAIMDRVAARRDTDGVYRKSGLQANMDLIIEFIEHNFDHQALSTFLDAQLTHDLACVLKQYVRTLSIPIVPPEITDDFKDVLTLPNYRHSVQLLKVYTNCLPTAHYNFLKAFCEHLDTVAAGDNRMNLANFALVLGGNFFKPTGSVPDMTAFQVIAHQLFHHWRYVFANGPFENQETYLMACREIRLDKATISRGQRLRALKPLTGDEWTVDIIGQPMTVNARDVAQMPADNEPPTFWIQVGGSRGPTAEVGCLEPSDLTGEDVEALRRDVERDLKELARVERQIKAAMSRIDEAERVRNLVVVSRLLAKF